MFWMQIFLAFTVGMIVCKLFGGLLSLGYSAFLFQKVHDDSLRIMGTICQDLSEVHHLKLLELRRMGKPEEEIEIARNVSNYHLNSIRATIVRNFISTFPKAQSHILRFSDWESAMQELDRLIKKEKQNKFNK